MQHFALPDHEWPVIPKLRDLGVAYAHVYGAFVCEHRGACGAYLGGGLRRENDNVRYHSEDRKILQRVMRRAQVGICNTRIAADDFDVLAHITQVVAEHLIIAAGDERRDRAKHRYHACCGHAGGDARDALLHYAEFIVPVRMRLGKVFEA